VGLCLFGFLHHEVVQEEGLVECGMSVLHTVPVEGDQCHSKLWESVIKWTEDPSSHDFS
jgi:hypothetical protein